MNAKKLKFENQEGQKLGARLDLPVDDAPIAYALFAHCFTCTKNLKAVGNISQALTKAGIAVLRFDFTGLGESEGDFADTNFASNVDDLVAAARYMDAQLEAPQILIGHSLGGTAILKATAQIPSAKAVVTIASPCHPEHVAKLLESSRETIEQEGEAEVLLAGRPFKIKKQFLDVLEETTMNETLANLGRPLLIFHSPLDNTVSIDNAADIFVAAKHPKSFVSLDKADHLLSNEEDSRYAGTVIEAWATKYIDRPEPKAKENLTAEDNRVTVRTDEEKYRTEIIASGHGLIADEPKSLGGQNLGPNPYDYLVAGLGACTSMTLRMYADRKQWPLEAAIVRLSHDKIHAKDCGDCETERGKIDVIERDLELVGPLDEEQRARLVEIADKCPVHKTLHSEIVVRTKLKP